MVNVHILQKNICNWAYRRLKLTRKTADANPRDTFMSEMDRPDRPIRNRIPGPIFFT